MAQKLPTGNPQQPTSPQRRASKRLDQLRQEAAAAPPPYQEEETRTSNTPTAKVAARDNTAIRV